MQRHLAVITEHLQSAPALKAPTEYYTLYGVRSLEEGERSVSVLKYLYRYCPYRSQPMQPTYQYYPNYCYASC